MALVKFIETTSDKLDSLPIIEGRFTFTKDDGKLYLDTMDSTNTEVERFLINDDTPSTGSGETGDISGLGALAYKDSASGTFTPAGTISVPTFTGFESTFDIETINFDTLTGEIVFTPEGKISAPTVTFDSLTFTVPQLNQITIYNVEPITIQYTPVGTVSAPTITNTTTTSRIYTVNSVGTLPSLTYSDLFFEMCGPDSNYPEYDATTLRIEFNRGAFSEGTRTTTTAVDVVTGVTSTASAPTFTGTSDSLVFDLGIDQVITGITWIDDEMTLNPTATVTTPTFTGTEQTATVSFACDYKNQQILFTPTGSISQPTFTGTAATVTVS